MRRSHRRILRGTLGVALGALTFTACKQDVIIDQAGGEIALTWSPAGVDAVKDVPGSAITSSITQKMAGEAPSPLGKDTWEHARRL